MASKQASFHVTKRLLISWPQWNSKTHDNINVLRSKIKAESLTVDGWLDNLQLDLRK